MKSKKGDVWVSAVMYFALGVVLLSIILAAGMPVINRLREKNTVLQTKELMFKLDDNVRTVLGEGPGSKRTVQVQIGSGDFVIDSSKNIITWSMKTSTPLSEPSTVSPCPAPVKEGNLNICTTTTPNPNQWLTTINSDYSNTALLQLPTPIYKLSGTYLLSIQNIGIDPACTANCLPRVQISEVKS